MTKMINKLQPYPHHLPWARLAAVIKIGTTIVDAEGNRYIVKQRLLSKIPGAEPRLLLEPTAKCTQPIVTVLQLELISKI